MDQPKTSRPFEQRFLDGYGRSDLRQEVQKVKPRRFAGLRKKYATWALGASLAFGGLGVPMKMIHDAESTTKTAAANTAPAPESPQPQVIQSDLQQAQSIAQSVAGGVTSGMQAVTTGIQQAATAPVQAIEQAPQKMAVITDTIKQQFFAKEVPFGSVIYNEAKKNNLPPELVAAVVNTESKFNPTARSRVGAIGLMQLVPRTGRWMGASNLLDPVQNIQAGAKYLKYLSDQFGGDQQKVVAAYNAGPGNVQRFNGVPPFRETRNYVSRVRNYQHDLGDRLSTQLDAQQASQTVGE
ncbi:MAG TPA: lytic transglycosylase domain-containing protein [Thermoanaerobaculia bacterium]|jgi:soluble lytic murein transglycosylase-like protein|nr:lytic transglycosylase domain-containing protein [Thermoanaerobaculia bacterium]